ncbi:ATP-binding protein [Chloroflexota bacterium]
MDLISQNWLDILIPLGVFLAATIVIYSLWIVVWNAFDRWSDKAHWPGSAVIIAVVRGPSFFLLLLVGLVLALEVSKLPENWLIITRKGLWSIQILFIMWIIISVGDKLIKLYSDKIDMPAAFLTLAKRVALILVIIVAALTILGLWGAPTNAALLGVGILVLILIFVLREMLADVFAGFELTATGQVKKRDYIKLGTGEEGFVTEIGLRATKITAPDQSIATIANSRITRTSIVNYGPYSMKPEYDKLKVYTDQIEALTREIASQRDEIQAILSSMAEGIIVLDSANNIISINPAAEKILGHSAQEMVGNSIETYLGLTRKELLEMLQKHVSSMVPLVKKRYQDMVLSVSMQTISGQDGQPGRIICALHDITELDRLDKMKTEFVSMVSHELRTPLTSIKGFIDMILDGEAGEINEEQRGYLEIVRTSTDRLMTLDNDLLDISRIESGRIELKVRPISLQKVIRSVAASFQTQTDEKDIKLKLNLPDENIMVMADNVRLAQIMTNLLGNACKYSGKGSLIAINTHLFDKHVQVDVMDSGIGISEEDKPKIFSKFYRVDNSMIREAGGAGLGLSIVKSLVEIQGGRIWVESEPEKGSTFSFTIHLAT